MASFRQMMFLTIPIFLMIIRQIQSDLLASSSNRPNVAYHDCLRIKYDSIFHCNDSILSAYDKTSYYRPETLILENIHDSYWRVFPYSNISFDVVESIYVNDCSPEFFDLLVTNNSLTTVKLLSYTNNLKTKAECKEHFYQILEKLAVQAPQLKNLQLSNTGACRIRDFSNFSELVHLNLSYNEHNLPKLPGKLESLDISSNLITSVANFSELNSGNNLRTLNLSSNQLTLLNDRLTSDFSSLETLIISRNPLTTLPQFSANEYLQSIEIKNSILENVNLATFRYLTNLTFLSFMDSQALRYVYGGRIVDNLRSIKTLNFRNSSLNYLDYDIFENLPNYVKIDLSLNNFTCDCRSSALINLLISNYLNLQETFCSNSTKIYDFLANPNISTTNDCSLGYDANNGAIVKGVYGADKILDCQIFGRPTPSVAWFKYEGGKFIDVPVNDSNFDAKFIAYPDGSLKIREADRGDIGIYVCRLKNQHGNFTVYQRFRLDYAYLWWLMKIYSIICGLFLAMASFALNVISGAIRRLVVWRVSKLERTGRVRMLLESMEKYKSKQMVNLHDMYASNINQIRENYRQQLEALRRSYASQADRFRDYRTTQMENVATHLDTLRDNYNAQVNRIRDYGSKHMERVYNVYQRRVTGVRNYTLQQRLRLMRQYKLKQRYINRILENLNLQGSSGVTNIDNDGQVTDQCLESATNKHSQSKFDIEMHFIKPPPTLPLDDLILGGKHFSSQIFDVAMLENEDENFTPTTSTKHNGKMRRCSSDSFLNKSCPSQETQMKKWSLKRQSGETTTDENGARKNDEDRASFHTIMSEDFQFEDKASP